MRKLSDAFSRLYLDHFVFRRLDDLPPLKIVCGIPRSGTTMLASHLGQYGLSLSEPLRQIFFYGNIFGSAEEIPDEYIATMRLAPLKALQTIAEQHSPFFVKETFIGAGQWSWRNDHILSDLAKTGKHRFCAIVRDPRAIYLSALTRKEDGDKKGMSMLFENVERFAVWVQKQNIPWIRYEDLVEQDVSAMKLLYESLDIEDSRPKQNSKIVGGGDVKGLASTKVFMTSKNRFQQELPQILQLKTLASTPIYCSDFGYH